MVSVIIFGAILLGRDAGAQPAAPPPSPTPTPASPPGSDEHRTPQQDREEVPYPDPPTSTTEARDLVEKNTIYGTDVGPGRSCSQLPDPNARRGPSTVRRTR